MSETPELNENFSARAILTNADQSHQSDPLIEEDPPAGSSLKHSPMNGINALKEEKKIQPDMFYGRCHQVTYCYNRITCGKFKNRTHFLQCGIFTLMISALFISVILPLVSFKFFSSSSSLNLFLATISD